MYTKKKLGTELKKILDNPHDIVKIARWAENIYSNHCRDFSDELDGIVMTLSAMEHGPEFEYSEKELSILASKLMNNEADPLTQIKQNRK